MYEYFILSCTTIEIEATIGQRGQVVIPKPIRESYNLRPGMHVTFSVEGSRIIIEGATDVLDEYLEAIPKRPEPESVDWDEQYYARTNE